MDRDNCAITWSSYHFQCEFLVANGNFEDMCMSTILAVVIVATEKTDKLGGGLIFEWMKFRTFALGKWFAVCGNRA